MNFCIRQPQQLISALVLTGMLFLSTGLTILQAAVAATRNASPKAESEMVSEGKLISDQDCKRNRDRHHEDEREHDHRCGRDRTERLPRPVANAVRRDLSRKVGIPPGKLKIINYSRKTWPNGCLGLPRLNEVYTQTLVEGWRITLSNNRSSWVYRTDLKGLVLRLENQTACNLPTSLTDTILQVASGQSVLPSSDLRIVEAEQRTWPDACFGLAPLGVL